MYLINRFVPYFLFRQQDFVHKTEHCISAGNFPLPDCFLVTSSSFLGFKLFEQVYAFFHLFSSEGFK